MEKTLSRTKILVLINQFEKENQNDLLTLNSISVGGDVALIVIGIILTISPLLFIGIPMLIVGAAGKNSKLSKKESITHDIRIRNEKISILYNMLVSNKSEHE